MSSNEQQKNARHLRWIETGLIQGFGNAKIAKKSRQGAWAALGHTLGVFGVGPDGPAAAMETAMQKDKSSQRCLREAAVHSSGLRLQAANDSSSHSS